jgi:NitT/TauT family transport system substrate-binding protein
MEADGAPGGGRSGRPVRAAALQLRLRASGSVDGGQSSQDGELSVDRHRHNPAQPFRGCLISGFIPAFLAVPTPAPATSVSPRPPLRRSGRRLVGAGAAALALLALAGCRFQRPRLTVPVSNWPGYEYLYLAREKGLAAREGLDLQIVQFSDPQDIVHAFLRGELEVAQLTTVEAVDICARAPARCPAVVLVLDESRGGDQVAARTGIDSIARLRGRPVAVTHSTLGPYVLSRALEREGLSLADVQLRNMPLAAMPDALARGTVDAVVFYPPYSEYVSRQGRSRTLFDSRAIPGEIFDVLVVSPRMLDRDRAALVRLVRAWQAAHGYARSQPGAARALMARRESLSEREFAAAERGLVYFGLREQVPLLDPAGPLARNLAAVQAVQRQLGLHASEGRLPQITPTLVQAALR